VNPMNLIFIRLCRHLSIDPSSTICPSKPSKELSLEGFFIEIQRVINNTY